MEKGQSTKAKILDTCMAYVCRYGLASISIGEVAKRMNMSRTGVISHFANKQDMQIAILKYCEDVFKAEVIRPSLSIDSLQCLQQFFENWMNWVFKYQQTEHMSCPFIKAVVEFQDQTQSPLRDVICEQQSQMLQYIESLVSACVAHGYFKPSVSAIDFAQQAYAYYLGHNVNKYLLLSSDCDERFLFQISQLIKAAK